MTWAVLLPIIAQYGIPFAYDLWKIVSSSSTPTQEQWDALLKLSEKTYLDYAKEAGVPLPVSPVKAATSGCPPAPSA